MINQPPIPNQGGFQIAVQSDVWRTQAIGQYRSQADADRGGAPQGCSARRAGRARLFPHSYPDNHEAVAIALFQRPLHAFFRLFNRGFNAIASGYGWMAARVVRFALLMLVLYAAIIGYGLFEFSRTPTGFIPQLDRGYLIVAAQLPPGASLARTDAVMRRARDIALQVPGVSHAVNIVGFSGATFTQAPTRAHSFWFSNRGRPALRIRASRPPRSRERCLDATRRSRKPSLSLSSRRLYPASAMRAAFA